MIEEKKVTGILVAAGRSARMGFDKLFYRIHGREIVWLSFEKLAANAYVDEIVVVAGESREKLVALLQKQETATPWRVVDGGACRAESVAAGVAAADDAVLVAIHDAARPFVSDAVIARSVEAALRVGAAAPALPMRDTVKQVQEDFVAATVPRDRLAAVQTPQVFRRDAFIQAFAAIPKEEYPELTDDCMVMERAGQPVMLVEGEQTNRKITTQEDLRQGPEAKRMRVGHGYDVHKLVTGRALVLGGVILTHPKGLLGHSDADVLCHAVMDALLGALGLGDIGAHFPDSDPAYKGACSLRLLEACAEKVRQAGYQVQNVDATLLCQSPKLAPHIPAMRRNMARAMGMEVEDVSVKATTEEGLGFTGHEEGMAAHCVALLCET